MQHAVLSIQYSSPFLHIKKCCSAICSASFPPCACYQSAAAFEKIALSQSVASTQACFLFPVLPKARCAGGTLYFAAIFIFLSLFFLSWRSPLKCLASDANSFEPFLLPACSEHKVRCANASASRSSWTPGGWCGEEKKKKG